MKNLQAPHGMISKYVEKIFLMSELHRRGTGNGLRTGPALPYSYTWTLPPWDNQALLLQLMKLLLPCPSLQAVSCFWDWNRLKGSKIYQISAKQGHYRAMRGTELLSWCYMNTMPTCSRRKLSIQTSKGSVQSRQNCQQHSLPVEQVTYSGIGHSWSSHSQACLQTFLL